MAENKAVLVEEVTLCQQDAVLTVHCVTFMRRRPSLKRRAAILSDAAGLLSFSLLEVR